MEEMDIFLEISNLPKPSLEKINKNLKRPITSN